MLLALFPLVLVGKRVSSVSHYPYQVPLAILHDDHTVDCSLTGGGIHPYYGSPHHVSLCKDWKKDLHERDIAQGLEGMRGLW